MQFSPKDIIRIIKTCQKSHVSSIKLGDLDISFDFSGRKNQKPSQTVAAVVSDEVVRKIDNEALEQIKAITESRELEELLIADPATYEDKLAAGELGDAES